MKNGRNTLMFFIFLLSAIVVGGLISELTRAISFLSWLSYGQTFGIGLSSPLTVDLGVFTLSFGVGLTLNVAVIICIIVSMVLYGTVYRGR